MKNSVKFDPGIGALVVNFNDFVNNVYSQLMSFRTIHQKRARFKLYSTKITQYMKNNIAFYLGCLLWAYHLIKENKSAVIEDNPFADYSKEQLDNYDFLLQVNFMENYFESYERDFLYYTGKKTVIPEQWRNILSLYSEFLSLNNGFVGVKKVSDIALPKKFKKLNFDFDIEKTLNEIIKTGQLERLLDCENIKL